MSENHQAELLARWLSEAGRGEPAPEGLDRDAVEAVLSLRPDLAAAPRVSIDDILDAVEEGPFAVAVAEEAALLAGWLDGEDPGGGAALDDDIQETIYALRPELAPAPRVDLDDIFGAVTEGPFASAAAPEAASEAGAVVSLAAAREAKSGKRRAWWALPGVGAIAAAAAALLMINPAVMNLPEPTQDLALEQAAEPVPAAPMSALPEEAAEAPELDERSARRSKDEEHQAEDPDMPEPAEAIGGAPAQKPLVSQGASGSAAVPPAEPEAFAEAPSAEEPEEPAPDDALEALGYIDSDPSDAAVSGDFNEGLIAGEAASAGTTATRSSASVADGFSDDAVEAEDAFGGLSEADGDVSFATESAVIETVSAERGGRELPRLGRNRDQPAAPAAEEMMPEPEPEAPTLSDRTDLPGLGQEAVLDRLRASAWSLQPVPDVGAKHPDLAAAYAAADAEWNAGRMDIAVGLLAPFAAHPDPDVVLDAAWNHAQMRYRMGEILGALEVIDKGLRVSGGSSLLRSRLYALQGQLYERRGQPEEAIRSYRAAVETR